MKRRGHEKRRQERVGAVLEVKLAGVTGLTHDVSASGVFFETDAAYHRGSRIHFEIDLDTPWGKAVCDCDGRIVRVERSDGSLGIAVQFGDANVRQPASRKKIRAKRHAKPGPRRRKR